MTKNFVFLVFLVLSSLEAGARQIVIAADAWCPYNCEATSRDRGFMVDIVAEILGAHNYTILYRNDSWTKALKDVTEGRIDAVVGAGALEAKDLIIPAEPLGSNKTCFYGPYSSRLKFDGIASLSTMRLGVIAGYLYGEAIDKYVDTYRVHFDRVQIVTGDKPLLQNIKKLQAGRIDALVENEMVMDFSLRKFNIGGLKNIGCDKETPLYVAFSPKVPDAGRMAQLLKEGVPELRKNGRLRQILARYGVKDWR